MALRTVTKSNAGLIVYSGKMQNGEKVEGYFVGTKTGISKNPKWKAPLVILLQQETGETKEVYASGSLAYIEENAAKDPTQKLSLGQFTVITKTGSYKNKQDKDFSTFTVQQDDAKILDLTNAPAQVAHATEEKTNMAERLAKARMAG